MATRTVNGADPVVFDYDGDSLLDQVTLPGGEVLSIARHPDHGLVEGVSLGMVSTTIGSDGFGERQLDQAFAPLPERLRARPPRPDPHQDRDD